MNARAGLLHHGHVTYPVHDYVAPLEAVGAPVGDEDEVAVVQGGRHGAAADGAHGRVRRPGHPEDGVNEAGGGEGGADEAQKTVAVDQRPGAHRSSTSSWRWRRGSRRHSSFRFSKLCLICWPLALCRLYSVIRVISLCPVALFSSTVLLVLLGLDSSW